MKERTDGMIYAGNLTEEHVGKQFIVMNKADAEFPKGTVITLVINADADFYALNRVTYKSAIADSPIYDDVLLLPVEGLDITAPTVDAEPDDFSINDLTEQYVQIDLNEVAELIAAGKTVYCDEGKHEVDSDTELGSLGMAGAGEVCIADNVGELLFQTDFYKKVTA